MVFVFLQNLKDGYAEAVDKNIKKHLGSALIHWMADVHKKPDDLVDATSADLLSLLNYKAGTMLNKPVTDLNVYPIVKFI